MATTTPNRGYQLPAAGNKLKDDVLRLIAALGSIDADVAALLLALADKSNVGHGHGMDAITGLVAALGNKLDVGYHDALANLTDVDVAGVANGMALLRQASKWIPVALQINNIAGLETALNGKATPADITAAINALIAAAPGALDTLNELAAALGNDPNFAATITTALAGKQPLDADLSAIAALTTTAFGRALLTAADGAAVRTAVGAASSDAAIRDDIDQGAQAKASGLKVNILKNSLQGWEQIGGLITLSTNVAALDWTGLSAYRSLRLTGRGLPATDNNNLAIRFGIGGVFDASNLYNSLGIYAASGTGSVNNANLPSEGRIYLTINGTGNTDSTRGADVDCLINSFNQAKRTKVITHFGGTLTGGQSAVGVVYAEHSSPVAQDSLRVITADGTGLLAGSYFILEGLRG